MPKENQGNLEGSKIKREKDLSVRKTKAQGFCVKEKDTKVKERKPPNQPTHFPHSPLHSSLPKELQELAPMAELAAVD